MPKTNGFVERFAGTTLEDFFRIKMHETFHDSIEALQAELEARLIHCNPERPHLRYRNMGRRSVETGMSFVSQRRLRRHATRAISQERQCRGAASSSSRIADIATPRPCDMGWGPAGEDDHAFDRFAKEVRRLNPYFPIVGGRALPDIESITDIASAGVTRDC